MSAAMSFTAPQLEAMSYRELQACCKANGAKASGKAVELKLRLEGLLAVPAGVGALAEVCTNSPLKAFSNFAKDAGPVHESPMKVDATAATAVSSPTPAALEVEVAAAPAAAEAELPSPIDAESPAIPNDGTFLDMFKAMEKEQQEQPWQTLGGDSLENFAGLRASKESALRPASLSLSLASCTR
jgi:hypothetical protein